MAETIKLVVSEETPVRFAKFKGALSMMRVKPEYVMFGGLVAFAAATIVAKTLSECAKVAISDAATLAS
jgi:hypothetical protein